MDQNKHICIVTPVYNDWECLLILHEQIRMEFMQMDRTFTLLAVNDGSTMRIPEDFNLQTSNKIDFSDGEVIPYNELLILELHRNLGHQKAIACGISYVNEFLKPDFVIVMDSDGEDKPEDIRHLIEASNNDGTVVFAHRKSRQESLLFKNMYKIYKFVFKLLSGHVISFGNFVLIPKEQLSRLVYISEIWNHFPGGIIRSKLKYKSVPIDRGSRYKGQSKMSLVALVQHGISSITVNIDIVSVRLLLFSVFLIFLTGLMFCGLIWVKFFSNYAIPGWTSNIAIGLLMIMLQAFFFSLLLTFMVLNARVQRNFIPALNYKDYIHSINKYSINV